MVSTLLGIGIASLASKLLRKPHAVGEEQRGRKGWWGLYLLVVLPATAFLAYYSVYVNDRNDVLFLAGFLLFSAGVGGLIGQVRSRDHDEWFFPGLAAAYVAAVLAALSVAALDTPTLPLVEINAQPGDEVPGCSELPLDRTFVKVSEAPNLVYLYNESGFFALSVFDAKPIRYHRDCPYLRTQS